MKTVRILSIDGGGIRGIIPAIILKEIKIKMGKMGIKKPFHKYFDLMAGTSTGGLIILGLSTPLYKSGDRKSIYATSGGVEIENIIKLYEDIGIKVFPNRNNCINAGKQLLRCKYNNKNLKELVKNIYKKTTVKKALTNIIVTSFDIESMSPFFFKKRAYNMGGKYDKDYYMVDAAMATASVPTYFPPVKVESIFSKDRACLIDGGVFAGNPSLCAYVEAKKLFSNAEKYKILSLGTGITSKYFYWNHSQNWGTLRWVSPFNDVPLLKTIFEGQKKSTIHMMKRIHDVEYTRLDIMLNCKQCRMDDGSSKNIQYLKCMANKLFSNEEEKINKFLMD